LVYWNAERKIVPLPCNKQQWKEGKGRKKRATANVHSMRQDERKREKNACTPL